MSLLPYFALGLLIAAVLCAVGVLIAMWVGRTARKRDEQVPRPTEEEL